MALMLCLTARRKSSKGRTVLMVVTVLGVAMMEEHHRGGVVYGILVCLQALAPAHTS